MKLLGNPLLETFVSVVDSGGFSDAQFSLGISQSAISLRIRDLEQTLGYRLCERGRGGFSLTEQGAIVYEKACIMLRQAGDFEAELIELRGRLTGELRIGTIDAVSTLPGFPLIKTFERFLARQNDVRLEIVVASPTELLQQVLSGRLHAAIGPFLDHPPELHFSEICFEEHRVYCGRKHPLFAQAAETVVPSVLADYAFCERSYDIGPLPKGAGTLARAVVSNMEAMALLIETGHYLGVLPKHYAQDWLARGEFRELRHDTLQWRTRFELATRRRGDKRRALEVFLQDLSLHISEA